MAGTRPHKALVVAAVAAAAISGTAVTIAAHAAAAGCQVTYTISSQWQGGFGASVTVANLGDPVTGWTVIWSYSAGQAVTQTWNATLTQSGAQVTATNVSYNGALATGGSATFGFNGSWNNSSNPVPAAFTMNGTACTGGVTSTPTSISPTGNDTPTATPSSSPPASPAAGARQMEKLNRGLVSVRSGSGNYVSWRLLGTDPASVGFNLYRAGVKVNSAPITTSTNYVDSGAAAGVSYTVRAVVNGVEGADSGAAFQVGSGGFFDIPISPPAGGTTPDGVAYTYSANDASVGDLDGDGQYEIVLKWDPSNSKDNSQSGYTGDVFVDAYRLNGTRLWRIDLGRNIRAGAHYTQFQVYDYDGDGRAEVAMKTADGTVDGTGKVIGSASADYRNSSGYILSGPEYLTMFNGLTGAAMATVNYDPPRGTVSAWGDSYGNRVDRFLAGTAYLDGTRPSLIESRGYYTRTVITAWDWRGGTFTERWKFDSNVSGSQYTDQGDHQLSIADVDGDGRDEIVFGAMAIDDTGAPLWNTRLGHGDAEDVGDLDPARPGLEVYKVDENTTSPAGWMADARTGAVIWQYPSCTCDNGRGRSDDIWAGSPGAESWSSATSGTYNTHGVQISTGKPSSDNFVVWWDADPTRELEDATHIDKWTPTGETRLLTASGVHSNNSTKATPSLTADLFGDWREEVIWPTTDNTALRVYISTAVTTWRIYTLMHNAQYREGVAGQNTAYNQPPHPSFFLGDGMTIPAPPSIYTP